MKKTVFFLAIVVTLLLSAGFVFADQENVESIRYDSNEEVKVISLEDINQNARKYELIINQSTQQYDYLIDWGTTFRYMGDGKLSAIGYTKTNQDVDTISTTVYLQQYDESRNVWINIDSVSNNQNNHYYSNTNRTYIAPIGFKYRLLATHKATVNGVTESATTYSSAINTY